MELSIKHRNETYENIMDKLPEARRMVYETIYDLGRAKLSDVCFNLNKTKNEVSGRITELKFFGLVKEIDVAISNRSNNKVTVYTCTTSTERIEIVNKRYQELINERDALINDFNLKMSPYSLVLITKEKNRINKKIVQLSKFAE